MARGWDVWEGRPYLPPGDFLLIRAHNGYREDFRFREIYAAAKGRYKYGRGVWGYVVPGDTAAQAREMVDLVASLDDEPELGYWSDIEQAGLDRAQAWTHTYTLGQRRPGRAGWYSNLNDYRNLLVGGAGFEAYPWWFANPSGNDAPRPFLFAQTGSPPVDTPDGVVAIDSDWADDAALADWSRGTPLPKDDDDMAILFVTPTGMAVVNPPLVTAVGPDEVELVNRLASTGAMRLVNGSDADLAHLEAIYGRYLATLPAGSAPGAGSGSTAVELADELARRLTS